MLVSSILDFQTGRLRPRQRPALHPLPAHLHGHRLVSRQAGPRAAGRPARHPRRGGSLRAGDYALALMKGATLPAEERAQIVAEAGALHRAFTRLHRAHRPAHQRSTASPRSCCATSAGRWVASTAVSRASTATRRRSDRVRPQPGGHHGPLHGDLQRLRARRAEVSRATCPTRSSTRASGPGVTPSTRTATSTWPRRCARR